MKITIVAILLLITSQAYSSEICDHYIKKSFTQSKKGIIELVYGDAKKGKSYSMEALHTIYDAQGACSSEADRDILKKLENEILKVLATTK